MARLFLILFFILTHFFVIATSLNDQGLALLSFKQSLQNQNHSVFTTWNSSDSNPCFWQGITCNDDMRVVSICLPNKNLSGSLHPSVGSLLSLRHVNLRDNEFQGKLPVELFGPKGLQSLVLSGNSFSGLVPTEIGSLKSLMSLDLSENSFNGSIPFSLTRCKKLKTLVLSNNGFSGDLPTRFGSNLVHLRTLNLSFNWFTGTIPDAIGSLRNLKGTLDLSHNIFSGMIPSSLGDLPELLYVDLSYNNLSGPIPQSNVMLNAGPNAFQGNHLLCGLPVKVSCTTRNTLIVPSQLYTRRRANNHSRIFFILTATVAGIILLASLFIYYLRKASDRADKDHNNQTYDIEDKLKKKTKPELFCFKTENSESEAVDENKTQQVFMPMDPEIEFDLDQLLKASAFLLGKSRIGLVYKVVLENGLMLAVRRLEDKGWLRLKEFQADVEAMAKLNHPNVLNLKACCWSPQEKLLIYDYIPNGDLGSAIQGRPGSVSCKQLTWPVRLRILRGIAKGLSYIHEFSPKRYVHGHITSSNILLGPNLEPKVSGFGLGRIVDISSEIKSDQIFPMDSSSPIVSRESYYQAPEALSKMTKPSQKWDVYSFGLVVLEMITGKSPVNSEMDLVMWVELARERNKPVWFVLDPVLARDRNLEDSMVQVMKIGLACVQKIPDKRPAMRSVLESLEKLVYSI